MAFDFDIPDELIRELGSMLVESSSSIPVAYLEHEDFKIGIRGSIIYVINPFGICQSTTYWRLPEGQAFFLYVCINRWLWASDDVLPCYLGSTMSPYGNVQKWGEGEA